MLVICWKRVAPGLLDSWLRMFPVLRLPWRPPFCILTRASSRGAVRKPATPRDVAPATSGAYAPAPTIRQQCKLQSNVQKLHRLLVNMESGIGRQSINPK